MIRSFNGKTPRIAETAFISEAAYIIGDVEIGEYCSVWPGAVIRADFGSIRIGNYVAVEDCCVLHSGSRATINVDVTIGDRVHIGHGAVINCRRIGNNVLIGMNATILHDTTIGNFCVIAAGCLVGANTNVPDRSMVAGIPGKIRGEVTEEQLWWVTEGNRLYDELAQQYKAAGL